MARAWIKFELQSPQGMSKAEEALTYGAVNNPAENFRVIREICRRTKDSDLLVKVGVCLLEELLAYSAHKIIRKLSAELRHNMSFRKAFKHAYVTQRDKGYRATKILAKEL